MTTDTHPSMHHFSSQNAYYTFVTEFASKETDSIEEWGAFEVASDIVAHVDDRSGEINVYDGTVPDIEKINAPLCPVTISEYSESTSGLPQDEVESISHLAAELLEQDIKRELRNL